MREGSGVGFVHHTPYTVHLSGVSLIIFRSADLPVPCEHGLLAVGLVLLRLELHLFLGRSGLSGRLENHIYGAIIHGLFFVKR